MNAAGSAITYQHLARDRQAARPPVSRDRARKLIGQHGSRSVRIGPWSICLSRQRLESGLGKIRESPADNGQVILAVRRPAVGVRELADEAMLDTVTGLEGDNWLTRGSSSRTDGSADPERQVTVMNARAAELVAGGPDRMPLAGDQIYVDLDLSVGNLPAGSLLAVGQVWSAPVTSSPGARSPQPDPENSPAGTPPARSARPASLTTRTPARAWCKFRPAVARTARSGQAHLSSDPLRARTRCSAHVSPGQPQASPHARTGNPAPPGLTDKITLCDQHRSAAGCARSAGYLAAVACRNDRYAAAQNQAICADGRRACLLVELRLMVEGKVLTPP